MTGGFKLKFSFRLPSFFRRRRHRGSSPPATADIIRDDSKLNNGGGDSYLDYYRTYWSSSHTLATDLENLPGVSDTAKILRFLLSGEGEQDGAGGGLLFCDDIIRSAEDYEEDVMGLEILTDKRKSRIKQQQKGSAESKRGQQKRAAEGRSVPAGGQLTRSDLGRGQLSSMQEDLTTTAGGQQKRQDLVVRGQGSRMPEDWTTAAGGQLERPDLGRGQWARLQEDWTAPAGGQLKRPDLGRGQRARLQEDWTAPAGGQLETPDIGRGQWARLQGGWSAAAPGGQSAERERSYSCEQRRDVAQNRFLSEESRAWYSTPSKLELRASEWL
jgi:hypothetical protein